MTRKTFTIDLEGKEITFETGKLAKQANGSVMVHCGDTRVFAAATASDNASETVDFLPLRVDYQEKFSSAGKTLGGFLKREGKPSEKEVLTCRIIDRALRPLFEDGYYNEIQVLSYVYSHDRKTMADVLAMCAASAALTISDIPLSKPLGAVRVGMIDGKFIINPEIEELKESKLDLAIAGTEDAILMIEGYCDFLTEEQVLAAIEKGHEAIKTICDGLTKFREQVGKEKNRSTLHAINPDIKKQVEALAAEKTKGFFTIANKKEREKALSGAYDEIFETIIPDPENTEISTRDVQLSFKKYCSSTMRQMILKDQKRIDGRALDEIRPIDCENGLLPRTHGSALFTRGETQALAVCTLGGESAIGQRFEDLHDEGVRSFYLHYSFPPFSVGEVGRVGPPGRREVGHGKLAERALIKSLPSKEDFQYAIRLESSILECNGSSSMASVCGGCLALMDAGVPIKKPIAGIAMGLILEDQDFVILSDIMGTEDALGDMDFKITGDKAGITAFQMDIKVEGITHEIMEKALRQAKSGRSHILDKMLEAMPEPNQELSMHAPRITSIQIKPSQIGTVIGPGGKQIRSISEECKVQIDISDEGLVSIAAESKDDMDRAKQIIKNLTEEIEEGKIYSGKITSIKPFGLFVEIAGGKEALCHISEVSNTRINDLNEIFKEGDMLDVKVLGKNDRGKWVLSHKALLASKA